MESSNSSLMELYRRDREKLLQFIISSPNLIKQIRTPSGSSSSSSFSGINFDTLSADYVLRCINNGGVLDVAEATNSYYHELNYPIMIQSQSGNSYFTLSETYLSGPPPKRVPPIDFNKKTKIASPSTSQSERISAHKIALGKDDNGLELHDKLSRPLKPADVKGVPGLGLPPLQTGLLDDDLRKSAYEVLVASLVFSGVEVVCEQVKKRERNTKFLAGLKGKKDREFLHTPFQDRNLELLNIVRSQMEISEAMDICTRQRLKRCHSRTPYGQINVLQIVLGLISSISKSCFANEKSYIQWRNRQANILEELCCPGNLSNYDATIKYSLEKIRDAAQWDLMSSSERAEILGSIRNFASKGFSKSEVGDDNCHLPCGYHLKIRLYEKLLLSVFDILEEGQLLPEADEILKLIKSTWPTLGITDIIHDALYNWVLFKQFVQTDVEMLLEYTTLQMQKVLAHESFDECDKHLACTIERKGKVVQLNLVRAILLCMCVWSDTKLKDYHRHFSQNPSRFKRILTFAVVAGVELNEVGELVKSNASSEDTSRRIRKYIESSVHSAYMQAVDSMNVKSNLEKIHPLAMLADAIKLIANTEFTVLCPVLHKWCPDAGMISATLLHQLFWERLKPFLEGISSLSQDVRLVLSASHLLDRKLTQLYSFANEEHSSCQPLHDYLDHYQIGEVSGPLILDWVIAQHAFILDWISRAFVLEEWGPLSSNQKHAVSIVEVFRMIEETVDQFFRLNLPVNITHLQALLSVVIHSFDAYLTKVIDQLVDKSHLYPPTPSLTRYEEALVAVSRKKLVEPKIMDEKYVNTLNQLTISKLCIRLNTFQYIRSQIGTLEDGMRNSWHSVRLPLRRKWFNIVEEETFSGRTMSMNDESIDELFVTTFTGIRNSATDAITKIIDFIGAKVVFWDLREQFLFRLYHGGVERARMDTVLPNIDTVLNEICGLVDGVVRDPLILSIFRSLLEGYLWVLLDGGPSRAFSESDFTLMEDDLNILKDFFVADGEGLPRSTVDRETSFAHQVLNLFSHQTSTIIQMLMSASEHISTGFELRSSSHRSLLDANTLIRVLCHKKDREASKFLKRQYQLPPSSEYEDNPKTEYSSSASIISDLLKRSASFRFPETGHPSIKSLKKKFQEAW